MAGGAAAGVSSSATPVKAKRAKAFTKVVVRGLPTSCDEEQMKQLFCSDEGSDWSMPEYNYWRFAALDEAVHSTRLYINFLNEADLDLFREKWDGYELADAKGNFYSMVIELSPSQKIPGRCKKANQRENTIEKDDEFIAFCATLEENKRNVHLSSVESNLMELEKLKKLSQSRDSKSTPLIEFLDKQRERRSQRRENREAKREQEKKERDARHLRERERREKAQREIAEKQKLADEKRKSRAGSATTGGRDSKKDGKKERAERRPKKPPAKEKEADGGGGDRPSSVRYSATKFDKTDNSNAAKTATTEKDSWTNTPPRHRKADGTDEQAAAGRKQQPSSSAQHRSRGGRQKPVHRVNLDTPASKSNDEKS